MILSRRRSCGASRVEATARHSRLEASATIALMIEHRHTLRVSELPPHHGDPFDRLLVAQAQVENLPIVTADAKLRQYDVEIIRA